MADELNRIIGEFESSFWGGVTGDVVGSCFEFSQAGNIGEYSSFDEIKKKHPTNVFGHQFGSFTDDTIFMLTAMESFIEVGDFDIDSQFQKMGEYIDHGKWAECGYCFDVGYSTVTSYRNWKTGIDLGKSMRDTNKAGNGVLMKLAPYSFWSLMRIPEIQDKREFYRKVTLMTHDELAVDATVKMGLMLEEIWKTGVESVYQTRKLYRVSTQPSRDPKGFCYGSWNLTLDEFDSFFANEKTFEQSIIKIIKEGGDTDTNACILGQLLGYEKPGFVKYKSDINKILKGFINVCANR